MNAKPLPGAADAPPARVSSEVFRPLRVRKTVDEVTAVIVDAIHAGLIEVGERLPREVDLARRLDVSGNTVSAALSRLEHAGVVTMRRGIHGGATVATMAVPPQLLVEEPRQPPEIVQILQVRRPLETQATLLTARNLDADGAADLTRLVELLPTLVDDLDAFIAIDFRFHSSLGRYSGNVLMADYMDDLFRRFTVLRSQYPRGATDPERGIASQRRSLATILDGDQAALLDAVDDHLGHVEEHFLGSRLRRWEPRDG